MKGTKESMKNEKGITLVALIITIILLIILAGLSVNLVLESNGILARGKASSEGLEQQLLNDQLRINSLYYDIGNLKK